MPADAPYSISDLARLTGLSVRTIRYYLAQGLIPAAGESGPGAHYGEGHLGRLRLVRRLQQQHLPLAEIRTRLASLTDAEVTDLAAGDGGGATEAPGTTALDYVRSVLAGANSALVPGQVPAPIPPAPAPPPAATQVVRPALPAMPDGPPARTSFLRRMAMPLAAELREAAARPALPLATAAMRPGLQPPVDPADTPALPPSPAPRIEAAPQSIERSQWERLSLGPNLELHVRRPLGRLEQKRVERLITIARQVLKEEQP